MLVSGMQGKMESNGTVVKGGKKRWGVCLGRSGDGG